MINTLKTTAATLSILMMGSVAMAQDGTAPAEAPNAVQSQVEDSSGNFQNMGGNFRDWDGNADGMVDNEEWDAGWSDGALFGSMDADGDGNISEEEYDGRMGSAQITSGQTTTGSISDSGFGNCDVNDDGMLSQVEVSSCTRLRLDASGDGNLDEGEFGGWNN